MRDFVYISDKAYTREQILAMEKSMLNALGFHLTVPTPFQFMSRLVKVRAAPHSAALRRPLSRLPAPSSLLRARGSPPLALSLFLHTTASLPDD